MSGHHGGLRFARFSGGEEELNVLEK